MASGSGTGDVGPAITVVSDGDISSERSELHPTQAVKARRANNDDHVRRVIAHLQQ
jgi:hypothetical protein